MESQIPAFTRDRIVLADALRGFALMGLFIVHMVEYFELYWYNPEPGWIHNLIFFLFGGKAYGIFALLFGLSFYIILDNYRRRGVDFRLRFLWRIFLLWVFGYIHSLLYAGDILQLLAICGVFLVACHRLSNLWLGVLTAFFLLQIPTAVILVAHAAFDFPDYQQPAFWSLMPKNFEVFAHGGFFELIRYNLWQGQMGKWAFFFETGRLWNIFGLMFAGVLLGRTGFFERNDHSPRKLLAGVIVSLGAWRLFEFGSEPVQMLFAEGMPRWCAQQIMAYLINLCLIIAGVLLFVVLFQATRYGRKLLSLLAPAGRMTLTFYVLQSIVFVPLYYGFGLAWYDSIGQSWSLILGVVFWLVQMALAALWLKHYRYGPLEWLWRKLTHIRLGASTG